MSLVLSLFPGIGLLDMAFEEEGFCIVRGPDLLWGGDIRRFHPPAGKFDGVIGGPPCPPFSKLGIMARDRGQEIGEDLIPEFARVVAEARPAWWLMENVPGAPSPAPDAFLTEIDNRWVGGEQRRRRWFYSSLPLGVEQEALEPTILYPTVCANGAVWDPVKKRSYGRNDRAYLAIAIKAQGLPEDFDLPPFLVEEKIRAVGNGVPLPMGRAIARAVKRAMI